ncbi:GGDEF domain-containing response regulator [Thaumasiovibrio subtropicus]|uniref:GGDEF domain-containing response regulator n=1 Tax=Thaumasiovibrio subtropicus TaxID=1891207 RepID=UPI0018640FD8|nr:diguanylate cyclase [Thaumasiovibrio subtropicus]
MKILLVDDVHIERMQLSLRLERLGYQVEAAENGADAIEKYGKYLPDLVLLDVSMPDMSGTEVAQKLRELYPEWVPIIFLSGHDEPEMVAKAIDMGGDDYLVKPVNKIVLQAKLKAMQRIASMRHKLAEATAMLERANLQLSKQATEDGLTGVANRRYLDSRMQEAIAWHGRNGYPLTVLMVDVDHFKAFNDNYGHLEGDRCLIKLAQALEQQFSRAGELVGRYGGEEFVVILGNCDKLDAVAHCERLKEAVHTLAIPHAFASTSDQVTVSQGMLSWTPTGLETLDNIYALVDEYLYKAKAQGRDCYVAADFL